MYQLCSTWIGRYPLLESHRLNSASLTNLACLFWLDFNPPLLDRIRLFFHVCWSTAFQFDIFMSRHSDISLSSRCTKFALLLQI
jgi:hypothetical protein